MAARVSTPTAAWMERADKRTFLKRLKATHAARLAKATPKPAPLTERARELRNGPQVARVEAFAVDRNNQPLRIDPTQRRWFAFRDLAVWLGLHCGVMAPRGSGKSLAFLVPITADEIGRNPDGSRQIACVAAPAARKRVGVVKRIIKSSDAYQEIYPDVRPDPDEWNKTDIRIAGSKALDPTLTGFGVLSESVGSRSTGSVFDDVDGRKSLSAPVRETIRDTLDSQVMPTLEHGALVLMGCTAWHEEDYAHTKMRDPGWCFLIDGVSDDCEWIEYVTIWGGRGIDADLGGEVCEPTAWGIKRFARDFDCVVRRMPLYAHFDRAELLKRRGNGPQPKRAFRRGYQQDAYTDEERWFPSFPARVFYDVDYRQLSWKSWLFMTGVDISSKKRPGNAILTAGQAADGLKAVVDCRIGAWTSYETAEQIADVDLTFRPRLVKVESVATQEAIIEWAKATRGAGIHGRADFWSRLSPYETKGNVHTDEYVGIRALENECAMGGWVVLIPHPKDPDCKCGLCIFVREVTQHPHGKTKDGLMAWWFCREGFDEVGAKMQVINRHESRAGARDHRAL